MLWAFSEVVVHTNINEEAKGGTKEWFKDKMQYLRNLFSQSNLTEEKKTNQSPSSNNS